MPALFPHVKEMLHRFHQQGYVLTVASSRSSASLNEFLDEMDIATYVSNGSKNRPLIPFPEAAWNWELAYANSHV
mgnify:CR=1 FL=1